MAAPFTISVVFHLVWVRPVVAQEVIVDDQQGSPWFTTTGDDWATWENAGNGYSTADTTYQYTSNTVGGSDRRGTATWSPELTTAGLYRVEVWFRRTENRTTDADHCITDGTGGQTCTSIDQTGNGSSGWVEVGEAWCDGGFGGCTLTLDGDDDDQSDEANAARFLLLEADDGTGGGDTGGEVDPCQEFAGEGSHSMALVPSRGDASGWSDFEAVVLEDGVEAWSENVDDGEWLIATDWNICDPVGDETFDAIEVSVLARTQYQDGQYALELALDGGGVATTVFTGTTLQWHTVDVVSDRDDWTWARIGALHGTVSLWEHPGGERDSDAWVDAMVMTVHYTTLPPDDSGGAGGGQTGDTGAAADTGDSVDRGPNEGNDPPTSTTEDSGGCGAGLDSHAALVMFFALFGLRRRTPA
jgi:hypothetical protein